MANLAFLIFGMLKLIETLHIVSSVKKNIFQVKIFEEIALFLFVIYSFIKFKLLLNLPKSF